MPDSAPNPELLRSLGRLVRGLSTLFWCLPAALIVCVGTASAGWFSHFGFFGFLPSSAITGMLLYGLWHLGSFQRQERPWQNALDRARLFALINLGLSPFPYWWNHLPNQPFFVGALCVLALSALLFLFDLNFVLQRLGAMLPDETLRMETRQYTGLNRGLLIALAGSVAAYLLFVQLSQPGPSRWSVFARWSEGVLVIPAFNLQFHIYWVVFLVMTLLVLLPLAMTMALIWKTKEVILDSVFSAGTSLRE